MTITVTQFKAKQGYYLSLASREDIIVTKHGRFHARIVGARRHDVKSVRDLFGILPSDTDEGSILVERANRQ